MPNGKRNPSMYGMVPKHLFDAMYSAPTPADNENPFVTLADLNAAVGLNNELSEILANGNTTGGTDISVSTGDSIVGVAELTLVGTTTVDITGGTGFSVTATTGTLDLTTLADDINITSAVSLILLASQIANTASTGDFNATATLGDVNITAGVDVDIVGANDVLLTATAGVINFRSNVLVTDAVTITSATAGVTLDFGSGTYWSATVDSDFGFGIGDAYTSPLTNYIWGSVTNGFIVDVATDIALVCGATYSLLATGEIGYTSSHSVRYAVPEILVGNGTPALALVNSFKMYSADIAAGNAAPHFETENGAVIKVYQETTAVVAAAFVANTSLIADDTATFGGYTIGQIVAALQAQGLLA